MEGRRKGGLGRGEEVKQEVKVAFYTRFVMEEETGGKREEKKKKKEEEKEKKWMK